MYDELLEQLQEAQSELEQFDAKYPELTIKYIFPQSLLLSRLTEYVRDYSENYHVETAYLDYEELADIHGISVGSFCNKHSQFSVDKSYEQLEKAQERFEEELELLCSRYSVELLYLALKISGSTAANTARLIDARHCLGKNIEKIEKRLDKYYVKRCKRFTASKELDISIYYHTGDVPKAAGIYFLLLEGSIIYIGRSKNIYTRINNHDVVRKYYSKNSGGGYNIVCGVYESDENLSDLENKLIKVARPERNIQSKDF